MEEVTHSSGLTERQIASIFKDYIGQKVLMWNAENNNDSGSRTFTLTKISPTRCSGYFNEDGSYIDSKTMYSVGAFVLKLKRLKSLSEIDLIEIIRIANPSLQNINITLKSINRSGPHDSFFSCVYSYSDVEAYFSINTEKMYNTFIEKYLLQCGYATPLFFGVGHPLNGKTAFDLGLAFENSIENG